MFLLAFSANQLIFAALKLHRFSLRLQTAAAGLRGSILKNRLTFATVSTQDNYVFGARSETKAQH
ncbi:hypothetical protein [Bradyrhizobium sp. CB1015]|uniref:hypothetical protein n=1 Tax=Bradyrhizobium sp. CB1015 TaxID=2976822 RepID=UPI0021A989A4|nr:hypothetical protein [Bradyrhizobium sp. CB1015]UWU89759.1 hypothetical protein N2604_25090 [Bradyrhizobium sp. CB1015]